MNIRTIFVAMAILAAGLFAWLYRASPAPEKANAERREAAERTHQDLRAGINGLAPADSARASGPSPRTAWTPPVASGSASRSSPPLPPLKTPLIQVVDELRERARQGDPKAACRLAMDLERCNRLGGMRRMAAERRQEADSALPLSTARQNALRSLRQWEEWIQQDAPVCEGMEEREARGSWRYLLQSAQAGHIPSMVRFADGMALFNERGPGEDLDGWIALRDYGPAWLQAGIDAGYAPAYEASRYVLLRGDIRGIPLRKDPVLSVAYSLALAQVGAPAERARSQSNADFAIAEGGLSAADVARAQAMAEPFVRKLLARYPQGSVDFSRGTYGMIDQASLCDEGW